MSSLKFIVSVANPSLATGSYRLQHSKTSAFATASPFLSFTSTSSFLPLTSPVCAPMSDKIRRRGKPATPPSFDPFLPVRPSGPRPIKVLSTAALEETRNRKLPSILAGARGPVLVIAVHLLTATVFLASYEGWALLDALYFSVVIATTVGYGDITPVKPASKIFVGIYAIISVAIIANMLQSLVERFADAQRDIASSARSAVLGTSHSSSIDSPHSEGSDLIVATRLEATRARLRLGATVIMLVGASLSGIILYRLILGAPFVDVIYFLCISMTTVGLGDIHPISRLGKAFAAVWLILTSLGFANILSQYTNLRVKEREHEIATAILSGNIGDKMFKEIDNDNDGTLSEAEYLGYILCKLRKASPDDVSYIMSKTNLINSNPKPVIMRETILTHYKSVRMYFCKDSKHHAQI